MPEQGVVWQKVAGKRSMRDDSILGYSIRNKLNLVRAAEACGEHELALKVALKNDYRSLCAPIAKMDDEKLNARYRDLWLERTWRGAIVSLLPDPEKAVVKLKELGLEAARNYETYGTTQVEVTHLNRRAKELKDLSAALKKERAGMEVREEDLQKREKELVEKQARLGLDRKEFEEEKVIVQQGWASLDDARLKANQADEGRQMQEEKLKQDREQLLKDLVDLGKERRAIAEDREFLDKDRAGVAERQDRLSLLEKRIGQKESDLKSASSTLDERAHDLSGKEKNLIARENTVRVQNEQNKAFEEDFVVELKDLSVKQEKLAADQFALQQQQGNLDQIKKDATAYQNLREQAVVVMTLLKKVPEIINNVVLKTKLGSAISKLAGMVGVEMSPHKGPKID